MYNVLNTMYVFVCPHYTHTYRVCVRIVCKYVIEFNTNVITFSTYVITFSINIHFAIEFSIKWKFKSLLLPDELLCQSAVYSHWENF